jgi:hypothetical protein
MLVQKLRTMDQNLPVNTAEITENIPNSKNSKTTKARGVESVTTGVRSVLVATDLTEWLQVDPQERDQKYSLTHPPLLFCNNEQCQRLIQ